MTKSVVVYSQPDCPPCEWTKNFLARRGIPYTLKDICADQSAHDELVTLGFKSTPVTVIDGIAIVGFDQARLAQALSIEK